jgi:hypothetical protein
MDLLRIDSIDDVTDEKIIELCNVQGGRPRIYSSSVVADTMAEFASGTLSGRALVKGQDVRNLKIRIPGASNTVARPGTLAGQMEGLRSKEAGGMSLPLPSISTLKRAQTAVLNSKVGAKLRKVDPKNARRLEALNDGYNALSTAAALFAMGLLGEQLHDGASTLPAELTFSWDQVSFYINLATGAVEAFVTKKETDELKRLKRSVAAAKTTGGPDQKRVVKLGNLTSRDGLLHLCIIEIRDTSLPGGVKLEKVSLFSQALANIYKLTSMFEFIYYTRSSRQLPGSSIVYSSSAQEAPRAPSRNQSSTSACCQLCLA